MTRSKVRAKRIELNLSQRDVARAVGISQAALSFFESGSLQLSASTLDRIAEVLGIDRLRRAKRDLRRHLVGASRAIDSLQSQVVEA